jgi:hypothetical protein
MANAQKKSHLTPEQEDALKEPAEVAIIRPNRFDRLPDELVAMIVKWVGAYSHASLQEVDRRFRTLVSQVRKSYTLQLARTVKRDALKDGTLVWDDHEPDGFYVPRGPDEYNPFSDDPDTGSPRIYPSLVLASPSRLAHYGRSLPRTEDGHLDINPIIVMNMGRADTIVKLFFPEPGDMLSLERPKKFDQIGNATAETDYAVRIMRLAVRQRRLDVLKLIVNRGLGSLALHVTNTLVMNALIDKKSARHRDHKYEIVIIKFIFNEWAEFKLGYRWYDWNPEIVKAVAYVPDDVDMWRWFKEHGYKPTPAECVKPAVENNSNKIFTFLIKEMKDTGELTVPNPEATLRDALSNEDDIGMALSLLDMDLTEAGSFTGVNPWTVAMMYVTSDMDDGDRMHSNMAAILEKWKVSFPKAPFFPWTATDEKKYKNIAFNPVRRDRVDIVEWLLANGFPRDTLNQLRPYIKSEEMKELFDSVVA